MTDLELLGLAPGATQADLKARYRQLALELHPDRGGDQVAFVRLTAAYERLLVKLPERAACLQCGGRGTVIVRGGFHALKRVCSTCHGRGTRT